MRIFSLGYPFLLTAMLVAVLGSCRTSKSVEKPQPAVETAFQADAYKERVAAYVPRTDCMTAKVNLQLDGGGKSLSVGGQLRMKRDEVIQLSITFFGMELGRLEFTPTDALLLDRFHSQYVRQPYDQISFLRKARLDFESLQSMFWDMVFVPGQSELGAAMSRFSARPSGDHVLLSLSDAPELDYTFLTRRSDARLVRTHMQSKDLRSNTAFECRYDDFTTLAGRPFPGAITFILKSQRKEYSVKMTLSRINTSSDWNTRTQVPSKYKARGFNEILRQLISAR